MNHHRAIVKALNLVRPVANSVRARRPNGVPGWKAARLADALKKAEQALEHAVGLFDSAAEARESRSA